jgi:hypothetical protein
VDGGRWKAEGGRGTVDGGRWTVDGRRWKVEGGRGKVDGIKDVYYSLQKYIHLKALFFKFDNTITKLN